MLYLILGHDGSDALPRRAATRPAHLDYVRALQEQGRLIIAGPRPRLETAQPGAAGFHGSLIIAEFDSLDAARAWAGDDPYARAGVFERVDVQPFVRVLPA
jgi:uncharacterized protein